MPVLHSATDLISRQTREAAAFPRNPGCVTVCGVQRAAGSDGPDLRVPNNHPGDLSGRSVSAAFCVTRDRPLTLLARLPGLTLHLNPLCRIPPS